MTLRVVGAGVGRTGTLSLKTALEQLTGRPSYHMLEVFTQPEHVAAWRAAAEGGDVDWQALLAPYGATTDFPACLFWREILDAHPDAVVLLSTRRDAEAWWGSASQTIFAVGADGLPPEMEEWFEMWRAVATARFTPQWTDHDAAVAAYERHNAEVRASAPADRLVEWQPGAGWAPLCEALGMAEPAEDFPHLNKREDFPHPDPGSSLQDALEAFGGTAPATGA
ncbi:MAG TPA: sulfotransferase [Acidimicrobiales bacterium]|nr:sulfotransferase [Acidimicrobiales bacterium]